MTTSRSSLDFKNLSHAYALEREAETVVLFLDRINRELGVQPNANPDFIHQIFETLTIDDSRALRDIHAGKKFSEDKPRIFLIELYGATREAQNALLKIFEEPKEGNHFFLVVPSADILLPTLKSRLQIIRRSVMTDDKNDDYGSSQVFPVSEFITSSLKERISFVSDMVASVTDEKTAKHDVLDFLNNLERHMYISARSQPAGSDALISKASTFEAIALARTYMNDRAPSIKMLLEYVALSV